MSFETLMDYRSDFIQEQVAKVWSKTL